MTSFKKKKVDSQTLGEKLKEIRKENGVSIDELAKETKIRKKYLTLIEEGSLDKLPADVYVKGFLTSYARYLCVDPKDVIKLYEKEKGIQDNLKKAEIAMGDDWEKQRKKRKKIQLPVLNITPGIFAVAIFVVVMMVGFGYFYKKIGDFSKTPRLVVTTPADNLSINDSAIEIEGFTDRENKVKINGQVVFVDESGKFKETISLQSGLNNLEIEAINKFDNVATHKVTVSANYEIKENNNSENGEQGAENQDGDSADKIVLEIRIEENPTWIAIEVDDKNKQTGTMLPGSIQTIEGEEKISITSGKANKTFIKLNGEDLGKLSDDPGIIRNVVFTRETKIIPEAKISTTDETKSIWEGMNIEYCKKYCRQSSKNFNEDKCQNKCAGKIAP